MKNSKVYILIIIFIASFAILKAEKKEKTVITVNQPDESTKRKFDYFFLEAVKLKQMNRHSDAFNTLLYALSIDSTSSAALYEISNYYFYLDRPTKTVESLQKAVKYNGQQFDYKIALANVTRELQMNEESISIYEELIKTHPDKPELNYYLSDLYAKEGEIDKAIKALDTLEEIVGMNEALSMQKYRLYTLIEQKQSAFKELEKLADKYPAEARYPIIIGDLYLDQKDPAKAYIYYQKAHQIDPQNPYYIVSMANYYEYQGEKEQAAKEIDAALRNPKLDVDTKLAILTRYIQTLQQNKKELDAANALFETLMEQHPSEKELNMMYGNLLLLENKTEEAKFQFQVVTESTPENIVAWKQLLSLALKEEKIEDCISICDKALVYFPEDPYFYFYKGIAYSIKEDFDNAIMAYEEGIKIVPPENPMLLSDFYGQIGDTYHQLKQKEKSYEAYEKALQYNDKNIAVLNNYAYFLSLDKKDLDKAERMSNQCIKMDPNNATYIDTYAWIFFVKGDYGLAKFYIESAISKDGDKSAEIIDHYGDILYMTGNVEKAVEQWEKAQELGKDSEILKKKISEKKYYEDEVKE